MATIRNPMEWVADELRQAAQHAEQVGQSVRGSDARPTVNRIDIADLREALHKGAADFGACRTDVIFLCLVYPLAGLVMARFATQADLLPLLFPLVSGFALVGPVAAIGLYEMSRRRERGLEVGWADAFGMVGSPSFGAILILGLALLVVFAFWLFVAQSIYALTLGPEPPASFGSFAGDVFGTAAGWTMIILGMGIGFLFAVAVLAASVVSFPLLLDRDVGLGQAVRTSVEVAWRNPVPIAAWGAIVAGGLLLGSLPLFLGLVVVLPVLGHATWHLYRKAVSA